MHRLCVSCGVDHVATLGFFDAWMEQSELVLRTAVNLKTRFENVKSVYKATVMEASVC